MRIRTATSIVIAIFMALGGCATSAGPATVIRTLHKPNQPGFHNILVVSVAGEFASRASFEQQLASAIAASKASASPYYTIVGRKPPLTRGYLDDAIRVRQFDAVIFTRIKGQEQEELSRTRPVGAAFDLFGYDYDELNRDVAIGETQSITFVSELYATATREKVWSIDTLSVDKSSVSDLIAEQALTIADQLKADRLLER